MSTSAPLLQSLRQFMDIALHRSMRARARFAKAAGLSLPQFSILMQLHYCTQCGISDISERFDITAPAASQLVDKLVQSGLIERSEDPIDRRAKQIQLSPRGKAILQRGARDRYRWVEELITELNASKRAVVAEALTILNEAARKHDQFQ